MSADQDAHALRIKGVRRWLLVAVTLTVVGTTPSMAAAAARWFHSPSGNISCEVGVNRPAGLGTYAYCATWHPPRCVTLKPNGSMRVRRGMVCNGNSPEDSFTLLYGRSVRLGPFRCTSRRDGMRCVVIRTGHGFLIAREGLKRF